MNDHPWRLIEERLPQLRTLDQPQAYAGNEIWRPLVAKRRMREAAVLIPISLAGDQITILFTRRAATLREHSGEMSFPGGRRDPGDPDFVATALREAEEEIGLQPSDVHLHGKIAEVPTITGYLMHAYIGSYRAPYPFTPNRSEIDSIVVSPIADLLLPANRREAHRPWLSKGETITDFTIQGNLIWGATGYLLNLLLHRLYSPLPPPQPPFPLNRRDTFQLAFVWGRGEPSPHTCLNNLKRLHSLRWWGGSVAP